MSFATYDDWKLAHDPAYDDASGEEVCPHCMGQGEVSRVVYGKWSADLGGELVYFECTACGGRGVR
jgi:hypothetical protein